MESSKEYQSLYNLYKNKTDKELQDIAQSGEEYQEIAKRVAKDILTSDRTEYYNSIKEVEESEKLNEQKLQEKHNHPLYEEVKQMSNDIRVLKNIIIFLVILGFIMGCVWAYQYYKFIDLLSPYL